MQINDSVRSDVFLRSSFRSSYPPKVSILSELIGQEEFYGKSGVNHDVVTALAVLAASTCRGVVHGAIETITAELIHAFGHADVSSETCFVPVVRSGLSMLRPVQERFQFPVVHFWHSSRQKGCDKVSGEWLNGGSFEEPCVILEPIIASGRSLDLLLGELGKICAEITVWSCYVAPEGLHQLTEKFPNVRFRIACLADSVNDCGYLVPHTNGDIGDKLYGDIL